MVSIAFSRESGKAIALYYNGPPDTAFNLYAFYIFFFFFLVHCCRMTEVKNLLSAEI